MKPKKFTKNNLKDMEMKQANADKSNTIDVSCK